MSKRWAVTCAVATIVAIGAVSTDGGGDPEGHGETWTCEGEEVVIAEAGRNGWVDGVHYQAVYIEFVGVFTPEGGAPVFESEQKFYGNRGNLIHPEAIRCNLHIEETTPGEGSFVGDGFVIAIPVN